MSTPMQPLAYIPSPSRGVLHLGPLPLRGYALMIILGVVVAVWLGERRWAARGGSPGTVVDIAVWAVPFGLVGGRLYHVITDYQLYFGKDPHIVRIFEVWKGGLGIWGAIAAGALGAYIGCHRRGISLRAFADAAAPGIALAQALGRWGNWFNQELYGRPTTLPWAVKIDPEHRVSTPDIATYHPTFLYESLWCIGVAILVIWAEKRFRLAYGRTFALYVAAYTVGRAWIEWLRVDSAHHILGLRLNDWTSLIVFLAAVGYLYYYRDRTEIPEGAVGATPDGEEPPESAAAKADDAGDKAEDAADAEDKDATAEEGAEKTPAKTADASGAAGASDTSERTSEPSEDETPATASPEDEQPAAEAPDTEAPDEASKEAPDGETPVGAEAVGAEADGAEESAEAEDVNAAPATPAADANGHAAAAEPGEPAGAAGTAESDAESDAAEPDGVGSDAVKSDGAGSGAVEPDGVGSGAAGESGDGADEAREKAPGRR